MNAIIITAIICVTLVALALTGDAGKDKLIKGQAALLEKYKALVDGLLEAVKPITYSTEAELKWVRPEDRPEIDGGE